MLPRRFANLLSTLPILLLGLVPAGAGAQQPKVLVIGIDGVRVDVLREVPTPNLDALAAAGFFNDRAENVRPTVSGPCWSSMLTGVAPEKHGVLNNNFASNHYREFPDFLTRIEMVRPLLATFAAVDWLPLGSTEGGGPLFSDAVDRKVVVDGYEFGWSEADSVSVMATAEEIRSGDSDALFVYLGAPDEISHESGGIGAEYRAAIAAADRHVGRLVDAVRGRPTFADEDWLILVSTDHGRTDEGDHGGESPEETTVFFLAHGPSADPTPAALPPNIMDVAVTALAHLGIEADPKWGLDGRVVGLRASAPGAGPRR
jgi:predicted AlkP superfamily pyrophosphatase or phosphodiesterase